MNGKIAITTTSFAKHNKAPLDLLEKEGYQVNLNTFCRKLDRHETIHLCNDSMGIIAGTEVYDAEVLEKLKNTKVISRCGTGMENLDIKLANKLGIKVFNTPDAPTLAVAELTVGLILNLLRKINLMDRSLKNAKWNKMMGNLLSGKKVGIIGFGRIGKKVASFLQYFNCEIYYTDPVVKDMPGCLPIKELLGLADIVSLHVSSKDRIIGAKEFKLMKKGTLLINVSRGGVIDEEALYETLKEKHLSGAAIDVFDKEPYKGPLRELDNVILTPHIGSYAKEARVKMELAAVNNLLAGLEE